MLIHIYESWEIILKELSEIFLFDFELVTYTLNSWGKKQSCYKIHPMSFATKQYLDDFINNDQFSGSAYAKASVLYSLYACGYLTINDIEYPTYQHWKNRHPGMTIDHQLPRKWFPELTFDCTNWKPMKPEQNRQKSDDFLQEGRERLDMLSDTLLDIKDKYL
ncbi:hypothetical protein Cyast_0533 [Cyanobacterium stanieri PCC 7202]|uniref:Uncharacterized protein n=1 Tax=Cyanobacterium stanieri (strain ATCC 29140 / PCC 7202) TaxID=292563 RepID=K9YJ64_CYASC|nr:hypothetical protein Cyast_0533 [Cyanobacterium stanieri PCC 7202]